MCKYFLTYAFLQRDISQLGVRFSSFLSIRGTRSRRETGMKRAHKQVWPLWHSEGSACRLGVAHHTCFIQMTTPPFHRTMAKLTSVAEIRDLLNHVANRLHIKEVPLPFFLLSSSCILKLFSA